MQEVAKLRAQHEADTSALDVNHGEMAELRFVAAQLQNQAGPGCCHLACDYVASFATKSI